MKSMRVVIIDYGSGNLHSISKASERAARERGGVVEVAVSSDVIDVLAADAIILPGVGAFGDCVAGLHAVPGLRDALERKVLREKTPFLGICVGMQMLAKCSYEHGRHDGLGWIDAEIIPFTPAPCTPVPHIGWSTVTKCGTHPLGKALNKKDMYFVHSYYMYAKDEANIQADTFYAGVRFPAFIADGHICAVQFHPEKSHDAGIEMLGDFFTLVTES